MSFSFFFMLPVPLKIAFIVLGGFFWLDFKNAEVEMVPAHDVMEEKAEVRAIAAPAAPAKPAEAKTLVVTVNSDGSYNFGGEKLTGVQLEKKLKSVTLTHPGSSVSLKADALTPHQMVANGLKLCKKAGIKRVTFTSKAARP